MDELTQIVHETRVEFNARRLVQKIKEEMPRKQFRVAIQAKLGNRVWSQYLKKSLFCFLILYKKKRWSPERQSKNIAVIIVRSMPKETNRARQSWLKSKPNLRNWLGKICVNKKLLMLF